MCIRDSRYTEFIDPFDRSGHGVQNYAWTAAHYILLLLEHLLGIHYSAWDASVIIRPNIPEQLEGRKVSIGGLALPCGGSLDVEVRRFGGHYEIEQELKDAPNTVRVHV